MDSIEYNTIRWDDADIPARHNLIAEEPLSIRVQGKPYSVVMRTPGDELAHAAGFCLSEGIVDTPDDLGAIGFCDGSDTNVVAVTLKPASQERVSRLIDRRGFVSQTSCGLCGKELVEDLIQFVQPMTDDARIDIRPALNQLEQLSAHQPLRDKTGASHAAALYSAELDLLSVAEDVGRHNALDKAIGKLFLDHQLDRAKLLVLSSRISYELVQKAARAGIPVILAMSRPTGLAVSLADRLHITLASASKTSGLVIFCGEDRLKR